MKKKITKDFVITYAIASAINRWLRDDVGDDTSKYTMRLDLVYDIQQVVTKGLEEGRKRVEKFKEHLE